MSFDNFIHIIECEKGIFWIDLKYAIMCIGYTLYWDDCLSKKTLKIDLKLISGEEIFVK